MEPLSVSVLTFNNERTLEFCLQSVCWANEIVVLDSFSTDRTLEIAREFGCVIRQQAFKGYGQQRKDGWAMSRNNWVLVLDSDEVLSPGLQAEIQELLRDGLSADAYEIPRQEQFYWRMASPHAHMTHFLRLFDQRKAGMTDKPVHAAPYVDGRVKRLAQPIRHYSKFDIHGRVATANSYSTDLVLFKLDRAGRLDPLMMVIYPPIYFLRNYVLHRQFLSGWAGFIASVISAFYAFLKYAKLHEYRQVMRHGTDLLPDPVPSKDRRKNRKPA
jgi:glycosyltransferase involved in cell wall biosynthesis